jgi:hypothetical protein
MPRVGAARRDYAKEQLAADGIFFHRLMRESGRARNAIRSGHCFNCAQAPAFRSFFLHARLSDYAVLRFSN